MDKKPLDPQLKQIYDRIMTTPTKQPGVQPQDGVPTTGTQIPGAAPSLVPPPLPSAPYSTTMASPPPSLPNDPTRIFPSLTQSSVTQAPTAMNTPQQSATQYSASNSSFAAGGVYIPPVNIPPPMPLMPEGQQSMPSIPVRPIKNASQPLIFSSKNKSHNTITMGGTGATGAEMAHEKSTNVVAIFIGLLVVVFLLAYSAFWLIFFGIIVI